MQNARPNLCVRPPIAPGLVSLARNRRAPKPAGRIVLIDAARFPSGGPPTGRHRPDLLMLVVVRRGLEERVARVGPARDLGKRVRERITRNAVPRRPPLRHGLVPRSLLQAAGTSGTKRTQSTPFVDTTTCQFILYAWNHENFRGPGGAFSPHAAATWSSSPSAPYGGCQWPSATRRLRPVRSSG